MRKALLATALLAALVLPAAAVAAPPPQTPPAVLCGPGCSGNGGGFTGCLDQRASHSARVWGVASISHYLIVHYCKQSGRITSISILAHGCDTNGFVACSAGPAWMTGGGVGSSSASFEAHATWHVTPLGIYNGTDVLTLTVPSG
jgi:hypothetical protein